MFNPDIYLMCPSQARNLQSSGGRIVNSLLFSRGKSAVSLTFTPYLFISIVVSIYDNVNFILYCILHLPIVITDEDHRVLFLG